MTRTLEYIEAVICSKEGIDPVLLHQKGKPRIICDVRQMIMYFAALYGNTELDIGNYFGRNHSTAHHAAKTVINNLIETDKNVKIKIDKYDAIIKEGKGYESGYYVNLLERLKRETRELSEQLEKIKL